MSERTGSWKPVDPADSPYNRRITADTPMEITGPAAGHDRMKTSADTSGRSVRGSTTSHSTPRAAGRSRPAAGGEGAEADGAKNQLCKQHQSQGELVRAGNDFIGRGKHAGIAAGELELSGFHRVAVDKLRRSINDFTQRVALMIVEKKGHAAVLEIVIDPSIKIAGLAAMLGDHQDSADLVVGARQKAPTRIIVV